MSVIYQASVSEWLRSLTRNQMGSARAGSNPVARVLLFTFFVTKTQLAIALFLDGYA